jgi:DME family drug/metabolite transporter
MAYALMALAAVAWATSGTFTVLATDNGATVMHVAVFGGALSAMILIPAIAVFDPRSLRIARKDIVPFLVFSLLTGTFFSLAWYYAIDLTSVTTAVILLYMYPSIVTVASVFVLGEGLTKGKAVALPITFIGCVLVAEAYDLDQLRLNIAGILLGLYAAFSAALYYLWGKKFLARYSANTIVLYMTGFSVPFLVLIANPVELVRTSLSSFAWFNILMIAIIPTTIGFVVSMVALKHIEASKASIVASIEPVAAAAIAYVVLSEHIAAVQAAGVVLVFVGVLLLRLASEEPDGEASEAPRPPAIEAR